MTISSSAADTYEDNDTVSRVLYGLSVKIADRLKQLP